MNSQRLEIDQGQHGVNALSSEGDGTLLFSIPGVEQAQRRTLAKNENGSYSHLLFLNSSDRLLVDLAGKTLTPVAVRSVVIGIADALELDDPAFMGCSVGGLLALDLAFHHPDRFRAVISLQGALHIGGSLDRLPGFWHPQVSNESKAKMMEGLTAPQSPEAFRKETIQTYAAGWPPVFLGDLAYYIEEFDLRDCAGEIDTGEVAVHILTGDYDYSATVAHGRAAHQAIAGSTWSVMRNIGHFPMSENPDLFAQYLLPVLDEICKDARRAGPNCQDRDSHEPATHLPSRSGGAE